LRRECRLSCTVLVVLRIVQQVFVEGHLTSTPRTRLTFPPRLPPPFSPLSQHLVDVCNTYKGAHPVAPTELARRMDGALLAIGTLADVLKVGLWCWGPAGCACAAACVFACSAVKACEGVCSWLCGSSVLTASARACVPCHSLPFVTLC
jgi:hypothetical protein